MGAHRLGPVELVVSDLSRSLRFYAEVLGLEGVTVEPGMAALRAPGAPDALLVLHERPGARRAARHAGLYHFALLFSSRVELARAVVRLAATRWPISGASDHGVSEAIYLADPDGNGIELYWDRPREVWPEPDVAGARVGMFTLPLDLDALVSLVAGEDVVAGADRALVVGHVHLHVGSVPTALGFYGPDGLGLEEMVALPGAEFVAWDGYHHHLGLNTWRGEGIPDPPEDAVGLARWTVRLDDVDAVRSRLAVFEELDDGFVARDPWGIPVAVVGRTGCRRRASTPARTSGSG